MFKHIEIYYDDNDSDDIHNATRQHEYMYLF